MHLVTQPAEPSSLATQHVVFSHGHVDARDLSLAVTAQHPNRTLLHTDSLGKIKAPDSKHSLY